MQTRIKQLFSPPVVDDEEQAHLARSAYIIASTSLAALFVAALSMLIVQRPIVACMLLAGASLIVIAIWLTRRGQLQTAITLILLSLLGIATGVSYAGLGVHDVGVMVYPVVIIMASLLLKPRGVVLIAVLSILSVGFVTLSELNGLVRMALPGATGWDDFASIAATLIVTAIVGWMVADDELRSLARTRHELVERTRAEEALRVSELRYRQAIEAAGAVPYYQDYSANAYTFMGDGIQQLLGYAPGEITPDMWSALTEETIPLGEAAGLSEAEAIRRARAGKMKVWKCDTRVRARDGQARWLSDSAVEVLDEQGVSQGSIGILQDITERKQSEEALRRAEEEYRSIVENAVEGIFQSTPDGRFLSVNPAMAHMYGYANPDDMIKSVTDITQQVYAEPEQRADFQHRLETAGTVQGFEMKDRRKDGSTFWTSMNVRAVRDEQGRTRYYEGTVEDISARKQAEESLKQVNATLQALIDHAPLALVMLDLNSQVLLWNKAAERMYGWTAEEALGKFLPNVADDKLEEHLAIRTRVLSGESITNLEVERKCKDGSTICIGLSIAPLRDSAGKIFAQMSIGVDITERKRAEETLQMFQYTIDRSSDAIQWLNRDARFEYVNDQACRSLGYTREELMHLHLWDIDPIYPKELWDKNWEGYQDGRLGGSENVETLHRRKDGSVFPVEVSSNHLWFGDRELHVAVVRDITERKRTEEALRRTQFSVDRAKDAIHWVDADGKLVYVNDSICKSLGYTKEELLAMTVFDIDPVFPKETWPEHWRKIADLGSYMFETVHQAKDGHTFPVEVSIDVMHFGSKTFHSVYARDITERKQTEQLVQLRLKLMVFAATHTLEELLQKTLDEVGELTNSPIGFYHFVEADQRTLSLQAWSTRTLNEFCKAEGKGLHYPIDQAGVWTDCVRERRPVIHNDYQSLPHRKGLPEGHAQVKRELVVPIMRDGRIVAILGVGNKAQAYTEKDTEIVSYVADLAWEITERKQAESEREVLIRELEAKNEELERFTYTVSHDLKSPLITIRGFLGFLEKDVRTGDVERMQADMRRIVEATDKMQRLLSELLELSRIGRMMNPPALVSFETIVHEALELVRGRLETRGARVDMASDLPAVYGDRARLVEVMQNLVDNAVKFMGDQPEPQITIGQRGADRDGRPIIFVHDNGIGIDPQYHEKVFGLFNKLDPKSEGTGIGLALVKRIVEVHGGRLWVESAGVGQGATFCFTLQTAIDREHRPLPG